MSAPVRARRTLAVELGGLRLSTPVMIASGCGGAGREVVGLLDPRKVGAIVSRTITAEPRVGPPGPRIAESASGLVWTTGLQNPGVARFVAEELPRLARSAGALVVSIGGRTLDEYVHLASTLGHHPEVAALEVHLSEPDEELGHPVIGARPERVGEIVGACARLARAPVFAKLPHAPTQVVELATAAARAGASGVTVMDAPAALAVDPARFAPSLGSLDARLSGPALLPITLRAVHEVARALPELPVLGVGGVRSGDDAVRMLLAGAWAVQVGTATLIDPAAPIEVARQIARVLRAHDLRSPADLRGWPTGARRVAPQDRA
jgi:dihydroorotate dehydrogenase (NAD+) catalytic subunit